MTSLKTSLSSSRTLVTLALAALALGGCSEVRQTIGLDRHSPDEFTVVSRAPLTLPPSLQPASLPKPRPGVARPQDSSPTQTAASAVLGGKAAAARAAATGKSAGESALVGQVAAKGLDPDIRTKVDQETTQLIVADKSWIDGLLFWQTQEQPFSVVDPAKEQKRLREAQAQGKPVDGAGAPTVERKKKAPLEGLF